MWNLSGNDNNQVAIASAGGIPLLLSLLRDGNDEQKAIAAGVVWDIAENDDNKVAIVAAGAIPLLIDLAESGNDVQKDRALGALCELSKNDDNQIAIASCGAIPLMMTLLRKGEEDSHKDKAATVLLYLAKHADNGTALASVRWDGDATPTINGLGDYTAARYRYFRRFVEELDGDSLDHALFGLLLSAESMRDEMRAYEEQSSALVRLVHTGHFVRQLQRLHSVLDSTSAAYVMNEPPALNA